MATSNNDLFVQRELLHAQTMAAMNNGAYVTIVSYCAVKNILNYVIGYTYKNGNFQGERFADSTLI